MSAGEADMTHVKDARGSATRRPATWVGAADSRAGRARTGRRRLTILITSAGRRVELLHCFRASAAELGIDLKVLACDLRPEWSPACIEADAAFPVPPAEDPGYTAAILDICRRHGVGLVVPTIDPELLPLSLDQGLFEAVGSHVAISQPAFVHIARDKQATAAFFAAHGITSPRTAPLAELLESPESWDWPLLIKPCHGSASRAVRIVANPSELPPLDHDDPMVAQELLLGLEYTVNMFFDSDGALRCAVPHERVCVRAGEVEKGRTVRHPRLAELAQQMAEVLPGPRGAVCFQAIVAEDGSASVFEINARFGGGYPLAHHAGAQFTRWLLEERLNMPATANDAWRDSVVMLRYDAAVFVES
jgi:carbamoyl-phosphate synthase large subunit